MDINKIKKYWDTSDYKMAHLSYEYVKEKGFDLWKDNFLNKIDFNNKIVLDYGIGGGYLGKILFDEYKIKKYIGVDISERQLSFAKNTLKNTNSEFYLLPINLDHIYFDIFICQAVIQHFPTEEYLIDFLKNVNNSNGNNLIIQIRYSEETKFKNNYNDISEIRLSCYTNSNYINNYLINYKVIYESDIKNLSKYQFLIYQKI